MLAVEIFPCVGIGKKASEINLQYYLVVLKDRVADKIRMCEVELDLHALVVQKYDIP